MKSKFEKIRSESQTKFLVEAAKLQETYEANWSSRFVSVIEQLKTHDQKKISA